MFTEQIYDDQNIKKEISKGYCHWYYIEFSNDGNANFYVKPDGVDVKLYVYEGNKENEIASSTKDSENEKLIKALPVKKSVTYYIKIKAYSSNGSYLLRCKNYSKITDVSDKLIDFVASYESFRDKPYRGADSQNETIGFGHVIKVGESFTSITEEEAKKLLKTDLSIAIKGVISNTENLKLNQQQFDALVSFTFNCGVGGFSKSKLLEIIKDNGSDEEIKEAFLEKIYAGGKKLLGLYRRRLDEYQIYTKGEYVREYPDW